MKFKIQGARFDKFCSVFWNL